MEMGRVAGSEILLDLPTGTIELLGVELLETQVLGLEGRQVFRMALRQMVRRDHQEQMLRERELLEI